MKKFSMMLGVCLLTGLVQPVWADDVYRDEQTDALDKLFSGRKTRAIVFDANCGNLPAETKVTPAAFSIEFRPGSADLAPVAERKVQTIARSLKKGLGQYLCVAIEGHSDASGNADRNQALSKERAETVRQVIEKNGVDGSLLTAEGKGSSEPLPGLEPTNPRNRRVVFKIIRPAQ